jgi:peptide/nickel transport system substrate-binding protein
VRTIRQPSYAYGHIDFELEHGALRDPIVRQALRLGLDRATIRDKIRHGVGILQETPFGPGHPFYIDVPRVPFDTASANALLDRDGWRRGSDGVRAKDGMRLDFTFVTATGAPDTDAILELIRLNWEQLGVHFDIKHYPSPLLFAPFATGGILYAGKFDISTFTWYTSADGALNNLFGCDRVPPKGQNIPRYCDRDVDRAMDRFEGSYVEADQRVEARFIQERLVRDVPTIVTDVREDLFAYNDDLQGFHPNQVSLFDAIVDADI